MPAVTVIIPNWNGREVLPLCLESLRRQKFEDFDIIVVDNGSKDGSSAYIRENYPDIQVIELGTNRGFCAAVNIGIQAARGDYIALLNNDIEVDTNWLYYLYKAISQRPKVGSCACKIKDFYNRRIISVAGHDIYKHFFLFPRGYKRYDNGHYDKEQHVFGASAAAAIYRRKLFDTIGLFDEDFFAYYEDVDLGFRAQLAGFKCLYVPEAVCYHKVAKTSNRLMSSFRLKVHVRNHMWYLIKCIPLRLALKHLPLIFLATLSQTVKLIVKQKQVKAVVAGYWEALRNARRMYHKRKGIQQTKVVSDQYIESISTPFPLKEKILEKFLQLYHRLQYKFRQKLITRI